MAGILRRNGQRAGFTIVELVVVIIVIGILAAVTILGYGAWRQNVAEAQVKSDLTQAASAMQAALNDQDVYPTQIPSTFQPSDGVQIVLARSSSQSYCINGVSMSHPSLAYYVDEKSAGSPRQGSCGPLSLSVKTMSIGSSHACYLNTDGGVYCWGANDQGNLGTGDFTASQVPKKVVNLSGGSIRSIAVGSGGHSCAVTSNGKAYCWGANDHGQLGDGTTNNSTSPRPVNAYGVLSGKIIDQVSTGDKYTCALTEDGRVYCWGYGTNGRLGNGTLADSSLPVAVSTAGALNGKTVRTIASGWTHTCAIASDDRAYCWGYGQYGALGNGTLADSSLPVAVSTAGALNGKTVRSMSSGYDHTCVIASDDRAYCWGWNYYGQIGNGNTSVASLPVAVSTAGALNGKTVLSISSGRASTCVVMLGGQVSCWGDNSDGQLGLGSGGGVFTLPQAASLGGSLTGKTVDAIVSGQYNTCAIATDKSLHCWGGNSWGQLGNDSNSPSLVPVAVHL